MSNKVTIGDAVTKHMHDVAKVLGMYDLWANAEGLDDLARRVHDLRTEFASVYNAIATYVYDNSLHTKEVTLDDRSNESAYRYAVILASCICIKAPVVEEEELYKALGGK